jgi:hypothetical protein
MRHSTFIAATIAVTTFALMPGGCGGSRGTSSGSPATPIQSDRAIQPVRSGLSDDLQDFRGYADHTAGLAANDIAKAAVQEERSAALRWRAELRSQIREAVDNPNSIAALLDTWYVVQRVNNQLHAADSIKSFGASHARAVKASDAMLARIEEIARSYLPPDKFPQVRERLVQAAAADPLGPSFTSPPSRELSRNSSGAGLLDILGLPLAPFAAGGSLQQGVDTFKDFNQVADRFTRVVQDLPEEFGLQMQLTFQDVADSPRGSQSLADFNTLAASSARFADAAEKLPQQLGVEFEKTMTSLEQKQPELRKTIDQVHQTVARFDDSLARGQAIVAESSGVTAQLATAGRAWEQAANAVDSVVKRINDMGSENDGAAARPEGAADSGDSGWNPPQMESAAKALTIAATDVRAVLADIQTLMKSDQVDKAVGGVGVEARGAVDHASDRLRDLINYAVIRLAGLILLAFILMVIYRLTVGRRTIVVQPAAG